MYFIACNFQLTQQGPVYHGYAVCSDPNTPVTFIYPEGKPYDGLEVWTYKLLHHMPWALLSSDLC